MKPHLTCVFDKNKILLPCRYMYTKMSAKSEMSRTEISPSQNKPRAGEDIAFLTAIFPPFAIL